MTDPVPLNVLFAARAETWADYRAPLTRAFEAAALNVDLSRDHVPDTVDYIIYAPNGPIEDFAPFTRAKAVLSLWAGVERIVDNPTLTQPLTRMVDGGLKQGMVEWVCGHVLRHHLGLDAHICGQDGHWRQVAPPLAQDRKVSVLGLGELGLACANALAGLGFKVTGWSRSPKQAPHIRSLAGDDGLIQALTGAEIVILLLPLTPATENLMNADRLNLMAKGSVLLNPGRGALIDDSALLGALEDGRLSHATLDVFRVEPLPPEHPFWRHPRITVTPHIASETRPATAATVVAENIRRGEAGFPFLYEVDRSAGY